MANCKRGDIARIISNNDTILYKTADKIVKVVKADTMPNGKFGWIFEDELDTPFGYIVGICDDFLRPIRDNPGEDETLQWAPVPQKELTNA